MSEKLKQIKLTDSQIHECKDILKKFRMEIKYDEATDSFDKADLLKQLSKKSLTAPYDCLSSSSSRKDAYKLAKIINVSVCPYCNEQYTYTVYSEDGKELSRPEFDHFKAKTEYPEYQLSLFNLVPSCHICNSTLKRQIKVDESNYLNPYKKDFDSIVKFELILKGTDYLSEEDFDITFKMKNKTSTDNRLAENNIEVFKLKERYVFHKNEVIKIAKAAKYYNRLKKKEIEDLVLGTDLPLETILFPDMNCEINQTSLGKLKRDISRKFMAAQSHDK